MTEWKLINGLIGGKRFLTLVQANILGEWYIVKDEQRKPSSSGFLTLIMYPKLIHKKHFGVVFDNHPWLDEHLKMIINKVNKTIGFLRKLHKALRRSYQFNLYKAFARLHLDYDGIINDQDCNISFHQKLELTQLMHVLQ